MQNCDKIYNFNAKRIKSFLVLMTHCVIGIFYFRGHYAEIR
nr:MAG TPA: hypothetical protein [Caudoviricetes sp.]